jgi:hypothetical protein
MNGSSRIMSTLSSSAGQGGRAFESNHAAMLAAMRRTALMDAAAMGKKALVRAA